MLKEEVGSDLVEDVGRRMLVAVEEGDSKPGLLLADSRAAGGKPEVRYELMVGRQAAARFACDQTLIESGLRAQLDIETRKAVQQELRPVVPVLDHFDMRLAIHDWYGEAPDVGQLAVRRPLEHLAIGPYAVEAVLKNWHTGWTKIDAMYVMYTMSGCEFEQKRWGEKPAVVATAAGYDGFVEIHANVCASGVKEKECVE
jgi:hypothetical protein